MPTKNAPPRSEETTTILKYDEFIFIPLFDILIPAHAGSANELAITVPYMAL
jgi:hypothetical protein